jgi:hypothetical protein
MSDQQLAKWTAPMASWRGVQLSARVPATKMPHAQLQVCQGIRHECQNGLLRFRDVGGRLGAGQS